MATYVIRRVLAMIPALLGISLITFVLMHLAKGGPFDSDKATPALIAASERLYHLNEPLWPTINGPAAGTMQLLVLILGLALLGGGVALGRLRPGALLQSGPAPATG